MDITESSTLMRRSQQDVNEHERKVAFSSEDTHVNAKLAYAT